MWPGQVYRSSKVWITILIIGTLNREVKGIATGHPAFPSSLGDYAGNDLVVSEHGDVALISTNATTLHNNISAKDRYAPYDVTADMKHVKGDDSVVAGSSYSRGLLPQEHPGYEGHEFDEVPHYGYNFVHPPAHLDSHTYEPHAVFPNEYSLEHYHHKHYNPALTAKALLLPVAGLALLGAAAALVSNPVFLQLGVVSGRRRRDTEAISRTQEDDNNNLVKMLKGLPIAKQNSQSGSSKLTLQTTTINNRAKQRSAKRYPLYPLSIQTVAPTKELNENFSKDGDLAFVPIPLKFKDK